MPFLERSDSTLTLNQIFNEEHAAQILQQSLAHQSNINVIKLNNVGVKIMKDAISKFKDANVQAVQINYNWNQIMLMPKLVCYDKNTWKTLQQLANWNREWSLIFRECLSLRKVVANITCSWADDQFVKAFLQGITALPNIEQVSIHVTSKNVQVQKMLNAFAQAQIFPSFTHKFTKQQ